MVLGGGGFRGAFQAGALKVLRENWEKIDPDNPALNFHIVSGVSVGSLNGLLVAQNRFDELLSLWDRIGKKGVGEIYTSDFIDTNFDQGSDNPQLKFSIDWDTIKKYFPKTTRNLILKAIFARRSIFNSFEKEFQNFRAIADNSPLHEKLKQYARKENMPHCRYKCGYVSLNSGSFFAVNACDFLTNDDFAKGVLASTTMPMVWPPVPEIRGNHFLHEQCVDGGIRNVSPLKDVIEDIKNDPSPDEYTIIIINCSSGEINPENFAGKNIAQIALRALSDIAITEIFNNDIREFISKNFIVRQVLDKHPNEIIYDYDFEKKQPGKPLKYFKAIVIQPDADLLGDPLTANERQIRARIEHGMYKAKLALDIHKEKPTEKKTTVV